MEKQIRKISLLVLVYLFVSNAYAQAPHGINYQAAIRDGSGNVLADQSVTVKIALRQDAPEGPVLYEESHQLTTDAFGLFNLIIGQGDPQIGAFDSIEWAGGPRFLQVSVDRNGGADFIDMGITQLLSVPYALYAQKSGQANETPSLWMQPDLKKLSYPGDVLIGGSNDEFEGPAEILSIRGKSKSWRIGVENKEDEFGVDSGFFISQDDSSDGSFHLFENGMLLLQRLHIKQPSSTGLILQNEDLGRGWLLGTKSDGKLIFAEGTFSDAGSSSTISRLAITQDGKVGLGNFNIDNPTHELHMVHASTGGGGATAGLKLENEGSNGSWWALYTANGSGQLELYHKGIIKGKFRPDNGAYEQGSDQRLKRGIRPLYKTLEKVMSLQPSIYYFKDAEKGFPPSMGFIAQDVQTLFPELVGYAGENQDVMTLNYDGFSVLAIKAIQEQQALIERLQQRIQALEKSVNTKNEK